MDAKLRSLRLTWLFAVFAMGLATGVAAGILVASAIVWRFRDVMPLQTAESLDKSIGLAAAVAGICALVPFAVGITLMFVRRDVHPLYKPSPTQNQQPQRSESGDQPGRSS